jgi:crotonobetainyl-CoA:carnitine CoA-transferase CaiB-like acyl-CoA transferase
MRLPLHGLRVLAAEQYGAGPYGSMFLAQLGAEVIKIENPDGGDVSRATGPYFLGENDSLFFQTFNLNKRSLTLNLKAPEGQAILHKLVASSHAVVNNLRGDQPAGLGITYAALKDTNPAIVCGHLSAYGRDNKRAAWPGYDYLMQAEAGFLSLTGEPDGPPTRFGLSMVDFMTGSMLAMGVCAALVDAQRSGVGRDVDVSLFDTALHQLSYPATWFLNQGHVTGRAPRSAHPSITPSQLVKTKDGYIFIMAQTPKFWTKLTEALERPDLAQDARFKDIPARLANRDELTRVLDGIMSARTTAEWVEKLAGGVPAAPVYDIAQALTNPFIFEDEMVDVMDHTHQTGMRVLANPIRVDGARLPARPAPAIGADTDTLLDEIGYDASARAALKAAKVV